MEDSRESVRLCEYVINQRSDACRLLSLICLKVVAKVDDCTLVEIVPPVRLLRACCLPESRGILECQFVAEMVMPHGNDALFSCQGLMQRSAHCCSLTCLWLPCTCLASHGQVVRTSSVVPTHGQGMSQVFSRARVVQERAPSRPTRAYCGSEGSSLLGKLTNPYVCAYSA